MRTILLVDDEQRMLNLIELFLQPLGFKCMKETSGEKAIEKLKNERINLVLLDVMMPETNGWEVCEKIREFSNVPIIMLTARSDKLDLVKGLNTGADDYITKPFDENELVARVNAILRRLDEDKSEEETYLRGFEVRKRNVFIAIRGFDRTTHLKRVLYYRSINFSP